MQHKLNTPIVLLFLSMVLVVSACSNFSPPPTPTNTPQPTATRTLVPTVTLTPTSTPKPTLTPNQTATQQFLEYQAEVQSYYDNGYLKTKDGRFQRLPDFEDEWAQLQWYRRFPVSSTTYSDFAFNAHFKWSSAYRSADISGCGVAFAVQANDDHYAVFLDRSKVLFAKTDYYYNPFGPTRGTGRVEFENPFEKPAEADFTLIVQDAYAYVLVNDELVGEYTLAQSRSLQGGIMLAMISGTNKDFGTRCEMTNIHIFIPD